MRIKKKAIPVTETQPTSSSDSSEKLTVKTPFYSVFNYNWSQVESSGAKFKVCRDFWSALLPEERMPESVNIDLIALRLSYEFLDLDHVIAGVSLPEKCRINLEAARQYSIDKLHKNMRGLMRVSLTTEKGGNDDMANKKENKTNRTGVVHIYLEIFENQKSAQLTDEQIADAIEKKSGNRPTTKNVASYRCYFNQGKLAGQKSAPKEPLKAVRPKSTPKAKKPMSEETKAKLKAYSAKKKAGKLKIKKSK